MTTRQRRVRAVLAAVAVGALAMVSACGGPGGDRAGASGETRTVKGTVNGDVTDVPVHPKRIVALWRTGAELVDLGVTPVAGLQNEFLESELGARAYARVKDVPHVGTTEGVDVEKVVKAEPDLILGMDNGGLSIDYDELSEVAPTVILRIKEPTDVWDNYPKIADLAGKASNYKKQQAALDRDLAAIDDEHGDVIGKAKAVSVGARGPVYVETSKSLSWRRIDAAGFGYLDAYADQPKRYAQPLPSERIADLAGADVVFYAADAAGKPAAGMDELMRSASFERLPAVKAGNVFPLFPGTTYTFPAAKDQVRDLRAAAEKYTERTSDGGS